MKKKKKNKKQMKMKMEDKKGMQKNCKMAS